MILGDVILWGAVVGNVAWDDSRDIGVFEYVPEYLGSGVELAPFMMPLKEGPYDFPGLNTDTFRGLPGMLADSLPDKFGNALIDQWLAESRQKPESFNSVKRLLYIGTRGMGALEFQPAIDEAATENISPLPKLPDFSQRTRAARCRGCRIPARRAASPGDGW
jgi:serine/threonine-protein kinase HipA